MKYLQLIYNKFKRDKNVEGFSIVAEVIFYFFNFFIISQIIHKDKSLIFYFLVGAYIILLILNFLFFVISRYVAVHLRCNFDYIFYSLIYILYAGVFIPINLVLFPDVDGSINYIFIGLVIYMSCDYINYVILQAYKSRTFIFLILIILLISMSIDDNSYNVALAFIIFILGVSDTDIYLKLFGMNDDKIKEDIFIRDKFVVIIILFDIFTSMSFGKVLIWIYMNYHRLSLDNLNLVDYFNFGLFRFLIFSLFYLITIIYIDKIKDKFKTFFENRYVIKTESKDTDKND